MRLVQSPSGLGWREDGMGRPGTILFSKNAKVASLVHAVT
jgi:hypothetical protein